LLILTRKVGEGIIIGENIRLVVLEVRGKQIRLGIEAPADVVVLRDEIFRRLEQENLLAAESRYGDLQEVFRSIGREAPDPGDFEKPPPGVAALSIDSKKLGKISVAADNVITFPQGLLGAKFQRFALLEDPRLAPCAVLQCVENPELAFIVMEPWKAVPDYKPGSLVSALRDLGAESLQDLQVLVVMTIPRDQSQEPTANLLGPILLNRKLHRGKQVIIESPQYSNKHRIVPETNCRDC
jgi:flagellar assembly factor FliW